MNQKYSPSGKALLASFLLLFLCFSLPALAQYPAGSPVAINGKLKVIGTQMTNECGNPVQLRGMSTHGIHWFTNCYNTSSLDVLVKDWGIDLYRIAMYVQEGGYVNNPSYWKTWIDNMVDECGRRGIYCMIDWHVLTPGDPNANIVEAREFWTYMAQKHAGKKHVLYEICNEPNGVSWSTVKNYANDIIPRIRNHDPSTIIIVGTPTWSQDVDIASTDKLNYSNIMYALHFYSGTHTDWLRNKGNTAMANGAALFVSEFGTSQASGDGGPYLEETQRWIDWMATNKISWANWSYADKDEVSAALLSGACAASNWNSTSQSGTFIKQQILSPADNFSCSGPQQPYSGSPYAIPGKIEAENFDLGGSNVAYYDTDAANNGGQYRTSEAVDIETCSEGGYNVGWTAAGEWLEYTVNVGTAGDYQLEARVAANSAAGYFRVEFEGVNKTGTLTAPVTGGWQTWTTVSKTISLSAGTQVMRVYMESGNFNLNHIQLSAASAASNLLTNPSFENGTTGWSGNNCTIAQNSTQKQEGNYSLSVTNRAAAWAGPVQNIRNVLINNGTGTYNVSAWARRESGSGTARVTVMLRYGGNSYYHGVSGSFNSTSWSQVSGSLDLNWSGTLDDATFYIETSSGQDNFFVDNCSLTKGAGTAALTSSDEASPTMAEGIMVYPNPAESKLNVRLPSTWSGTAKLELVTLDGRTVLAYQIKDREHTLDLSGQPAGIYLLRLMQGDRQVLRKIMKQ